MPNAGLTYNPKPPFINRMIEVGSYHYFVSFGHFNIAAAEAENGENIGMSLLQNSLGSGIYCREELLSLGARASRPHKTWQGRGDWLHRVGRFTRRLTLEQRLDKYAGGTPALPGGNPWLARCRSLSRALFCRSILPPSHARLRILQKARISTDAGAQAAKALWHLKKCLEIYDDLIISVEPMTIADSARQVLSTFKWDSFHKELISSGSTIDELNQWNQLVSAARSLDPVEAIRLFVNKVRMVLPKLELISTQFNRGQMNPDELHKTITL